MENMNKKVLIVYVSPEGKKYIDIGASNVLGLTMNNTISYDDKRIEITDEVYDNLKNMGLEIKEVLINNKKLKLTIYKDENDIYFISKMTAKVLKTPKDETYNKEYDLSLIPITKETYDEYCQTYEVETIELEKTLEEEPLKKAM